MLVRCRAKDMWNSKMGVAYFFVSIPWSFLTQTSFTLKFWQRRDLNLMFWRHHFCLIPFQNILMILFIHVSEKSIFFLSKVFSKAADNEPFGWWKAKIVTQKGEVCSVLFIFCFDIFVAQGNRTLLVVCC